MLNSTRAAVRDRRHALTWAVIGLLVAAPFLLAHLNVKPAPDGDAGRRALATVSELQELGPRVVGNEALARGLDLVARELEAIPGLQVQRQNASGTSRFDDRDIAYTVDNVVARQQGAGDDALLVNVHVDSAFEGPGAADDGVAVGALIEAARELAGVDRQRSVVYLFNGGEEVGLAGSNAFLQHPWAKTVRWYLNLEAVGSSGLPIMFHAGEDDGGMIELVGDTPRPHGTVVGQELFDAGLINSDTDSRVWRAEGWSGLDYAVFGDGYAYHTPADRVERIGPGVAQAYVDLVTRFAGDVADGAEVAGEAPNPAYVDVQSRWWVTFDPVVTKVWTLALLLALVVLVWWAGRSWAVPARRVVASAAAALLGVLLAVPAGAVVGGALWLVGGSHAWYAKPWLVYVALLPPTVVGALLPQVLLRRRALRRAPDRDDGAEVVLLGNAAVVTALGVATAWLDFGPGYLLWVGSAFLVVSLGPAVVLPERWRALPLVLTTAAQCLLVAEFARGLLELAVPQLGRLPTAIPMDPVLGVVVAVVGVLLAVAFAPFVFHAGHVRRFVAAATAITAVGLVIGAFSTPYDAEHPKYVAAFHTQTDGEPARIELEGRDFHTPQALGLVDEVAAGTGLAVVDGALVAEDVRAPSGTVEFTTAGPTQPLRVAVGPNPASLVRITVTGAVRSIDGRPFEGGEAVLDLVGRPGGHTAAIERTGPVRIEVDQVFPSTGPDVAKVLGALPDWVVGHGRTIVQRTFADPGCERDQPCPVQAVGSR
ncbi:M20/M25/M40 family metallo-hydrolase [Saccharothrix sp. BKS2]|uniref:M28 family peptidase n=1 Tax=Saccharothrix sp. BKS2 TaxID=3064400 RepID=UPI0039E7D0FD